MGRKSSSKGAHPGPSSSISNPASSTEVIWTSADAVAESAILEEIATPSLGKKKPKQKRRKRKRTKSCPEEGEAGGGNSAFDGWFESDAGGVYIDGADEPLPLVWFNSDDYETSPPLSTSLEALTSTLQSVKSALTPLSTSYSVWHAARLSINPFEMLNHPRHGCNPFVNRAGLKIANVDAVIGGDLTPLEGWDGSRDGSRDGSKEFKFVDLCGAPGGFSEYVFSRCSSKSISARGWGMSLIGSNDEGEGTGWKLDHMLTTNNDVRFTVCCGQDGSGDIYSTQNVESLVKSVGSRVELVLADGGFDKQRDHAEQEKIATKIVGAQMSACTLLLAEGGSFVLKYFGSSREITREMFYRMSKCFLDFDVVKPVSSRPASAERYAVFRGFRGCTDATLTEFLRDVKEEDTVCAEDSSQEDERATREKKMFNDYMDFIDTTMLRLNIESCKLILQTLEKKNEVDDEAGEFCLGPNVFVDVKEYKYALGV